MARAESDALAQDGLGVVGQMRAAGVTADGVTLNMLMELVAEAGLHRIDGRDNARRVLLMMRAAGVVADMTTWSSLARVWSAPARPKQLASEPTSPAAAGDGTTMTQVADGAAGRSGMSGLCEWEHADDESSGGGVIWAGVMRGLLDVLHREAEQGRAGPKDVWLLLDEMHVLQLVPSAQFARLCLEVRQSRSRLPPLPDRPEQQRCSVERRGVSMHSAAPPAAEKSASAAARVDAYCRCCCWWGNRGHEGRTETRRAAGVGKRLVDLFSLSGAVVRAVEIAFSLPPRIHGSGRLGAVAQPSFSVPLGAPTDLDSCAGVRAGIAVRRRKCRRMPADI